MVPSDDMRFLLRVKLSAWRGRTEEGGEEDPAMYSPVMLRTPDAQTRKSACRAPEKESHCVCGDCHRGPERLAQVFMFESRLHPRDLGIGEAESASMLAPGGYDATRLIDDHFCFRTFDCEVFGDR